MNRPWVRNTAISCAIACGAMVAGPGMVGTTVASADLFGIDLDVLDLFDHKPKKNKKSHSGGAKVGAQRNGGAKKSGAPRRTGFGGPARRGAKKTAAVGQRDASESSGPVRRSAPSADAPEAAAGFDGTFGGTGQALPGIASGGGGGEVPTNSNIGRAPNLAPVPTAPSARSIVIRAEPPEAPAVPVSPPAASAPAPVAPMPVVLPPLPTVVPPLPAPPGAGLPATPSGPGMNPPSPQRLPADSLSVRSIPDSFRIGYADYLRAASTTDLLFAVLPGVAGMVLLTAAGGVAGFRQARAAQTLPSPQIARFLP